MGSAAPAAPSNPRTSDGSGSRATIASATGANRSIDWVPDTATAIGTPSAGLSQRFAESTGKCSPSRLTYSSSNRQRMISIASESMTSRTFAGGQPRPTTCPLRFSPAPRPRVKRSPPASSATVAAFCATTAEWYRMIGQVT